MSNIIKFDQFKITSEVRVEDGDFWLTQKQLAELFGLDVKTISFHITNMKEDGELDESSILYYQIIAESSFSGQKDVAHYNSDVAYDLGFRVRNSALAKKFRAHTKVVLKALARDGIVMDKEALTKKKDAIEIALEALREIRASESSAAMKLNAFFHHSTTDFDEASFDHKNFYAYVQNKLHYAIHEHTAAELIVARSSATKDNAGLTTFRGSQPTAKDVVIAKNYLSEEELKKMNQLVNIILDCAIDFLSRGMKKPASFWYEFVDKFIDALGRPVLRGAGNYKKSDADDIAKGRLAEYRHNKLLKS
jgi:hypothetical protein